MAKAGFADVFISLRGLLEPYAKRPGFTHTEVVDRYQLASTTKTDRVGRPLFVAGVQVNRTYVSFHLMPIYMNPSLQKAVPAALKKRMQGKSCFNFTSIDPEQLQALRALTAEAIASFEDAKLPWDDRQESARKKARSSPR
jgi:hypothetical protein